MLLFSFKPFIIYAYSSQKSNETFVIFIKAC